MAACDNSNWAIVARCLKGHQDALDLCQHLNHVVNIWDDLIDRDKPVTPDKISSAFQSALVHIPRNPFYQAYFRELQPLIEVCIANWLAANTFERTSSEELRARAHTLRFGGVDVMVMCARLIGGMEWANECAAELRRVYPVETLDDYLRELGQ